MAFFETHGQNVFLWNYLQKKVQESWSDISHIGKKNISHSVILFLIKTTTFLPTSLQVQSIERKLHFLLDSDEIRRRLNRKDLLSLILSAILSKKGLIQVYLIDAYTFYFSFRVLLDLKKKKKLIKATMSCMDFIKFIYVTMVTAFPPIEHMSDLCTRIFILEHWVFLEWLI